MKGFKQGAQCGTGVVSHGSAMGFAKGGQVKDPGVMPASKGTTAQEQEAGGHGRLKPGYMHGGKVASKAHKTGKMPPKNQGEGKKAVGRGAKAVGKGGKTGMHKSGRITKKG